MIIQCQGINAILQKKDPSIISANNLTQDFFSDYKDEYNYIVDHIARYGNVPDQATFLSAFPNFDVIEVNESTDYIVDQLYEDRNKRQLAKTFNSVRDLLTADKVDEAMRLFTSAAGQVTQSRKIKSIDIFRDTSRYDAYVERINDFSKYYVKTGFPELDEIIGGWDRQEELVTIAARPGVGKCLEKGTEVMMADGSLRKIEDVQVGDYVQSIEGANKVLALHSGISRGYRIVPKRGDPFVVSENHILTLAKFTVRKNFDLKDITVEEFLSLPQNQRELYKLCKLKMFAGRNSKKRRSYRTVAFEIEEVPEIEYFGFMCDGDHRFLLADGTVTHNSWVALKVAIAAAQQGLNVGLYAGEMSERKVGYRADTLISHISNSKITRGDGDIQVEYKKFLDHVADSIPGSLKVITPQSIGGLATVSTLRAFIEQDHLDMLCIDQHSLLEDERKGRSPVEKAANISRDLKALQVLKKIPIIAVSQQNRESTEEVGVSTANIAQSDRIGQDSTIVVFLSQKDDVFTLSLTKARDATSGKELKYAIDLNRGIFTYIPVDSGDSSSKDDCDTLRAQFESDEYISNSSGEDIPW